MYCSNGSSSMATLLQQKNCMKTLTNGGGGGGNGSGQTTRVLLPHELVSIPTAPLTTSGSAIASHSSSLTNLPITTTTNQHQPQTIHNQHPYNNYGYYNSIHSNIDTASMYRQPSTSTATLHHPHIQNSSNIISTSLNTAVYNNQTVMAPDSTTESTAEINGIDQTKLETATEQNTIQQMEEDQEPEPEIDIVINNVVCSFSVRCHLNLREIALNGINVEFRRENGMVTMKLRRPYTTASIWSSGRITCTGATSEDQAKIAARRYARCLQKLGFSVKFNNFRVVNVLGTCSMPWAIKIVNFSEKYKQDASYEPELHPGVTYKLKFPKATLKIFSTGSITVTASSVANVQAAIEHIFPLVYEFRKKRPPTEPSAKEKAAAAELNTRRKHPFGHASNDPTEDNMYVSESEDFDETEDNV